MKTRRLGTSTLVVSELGFGCMGLNSVYGGAADPAAMIDLVRRAVDLGITLFDTAQVYGPRSNEELVGKALESVRDQVVIATKFGYDLDPDGGPVPVGLNSRPEHIKATADESLRRLRTDRIDLLSAPGRSRGSSRRRGGGRRGSDRSGKGWPFRPVGSERRDRPQGSCNLPGHRTAIRILALGARTGMWNAERVGVAWDWLCRLQPIGTWLPDGSNDTR